jgi:hypothetical protein
VSVDLDGGEVIAGSDVREAHEGMHQGELAGMIKPQSWNAFPCRTNGRFGEPLQLAAIDAPPSIVDVEVVLNDPSVCDLQMPSVGVVVADCCHDAGGFTCLQNHHDFVWFCSIEVGSTKSSRRPCGASITGMLRLLAHALSQVWN